MAIQRHTAIVPAERVKLDAKKLVISDQPHSPPQVILNRDGSQIRSIEIHCSCGEQVILDCLYLGSAMKS